jgi:hypothetical protein
LNMNLTFNKPLITLIITIIMFKSTQCLTCYSCNSNSGPGPCGQFVTNETAVTTCVNYCGTHV